jgi:hypothetical protein
VGVLPEKGFSSVIINPWKEDQSGNFMQIVHCAGNGNLQCVGSLAQRPNPNNSDAMIQDRMNSIKTDICNLYFSGQTSGSRNYSIISNDNTAGNVSIFVNWSELDVNNLSIVFNFTIQ